jgi:uncharacterized protein with FMN-binding domain
MKSNSKAAIAFISALIAALVVSCATPVVEVTNPDFAKLHDGSYEGSYKGSMGAATVSVTITARRLSAIDLKKFSSSPVGTPAKAIVERVLKAQSLNVDAVSGATYSSSVIRRAVQDALEKSIAQ